MGWFRRSESPAVPEVAVQAQPLTVGKASDLRLARRLMRLYDWLDAKGEANPDKAADIRADIDRHRYALASRGHPLCKNHADAKALELTVAREG